MRAVYRAAGGRDGSGGLNTAAFALQFRFVLLLYCVWGQTEGGATSTRGWFVSRSKVSGRGCRFSRALVPSPPCAAFPQAQFCPEGCREATSWERGGAPRALSASAVAPGRSADAGLRAAAPRVVGPSRREGRVALGEPSQQGRLSLYICIPLRSASGQGTYEISVDRSSPRRSRAANTGIGNAASAAWCL